MTDYQLTALQLHILDVLWSRPEATVLDVQEALRPERELAQSTVATLLARLERKALVSHRSEGRHYIYRATVKATDVRRSVAADVKSLANRLFGGDVAELVNHLLAGKDVSRSDLEKVRRMIEEREKELSRRKGRRA